MIRTDLVNIYVWHSINSSRDIVAIPVPDHVGMCRSGKYIVPNIEVVPNVVRR